MLRDPSRTERSQKLLVLFILWNLYSKYRRHPIDEERLRKAFTFAIPVLAKHGVDLELYYSTDSKGFPVLDAFLSEALSHELISENGGLDSTFSFKNGAGISLMKLYEYPPHDDLLILEEAAKDVLLAYKNDADLATHFYPRRNGNNCH